MTNEQLYLAVGVPLLVNGLLALLLNARIGSIEGRIGAVDTMLGSRIAGIEARKLNLENTFTARFDLLMGRMAELEKQIHER